MHAWKKETNEAKKRSVLTDWHIYYEQSEKDTTAAIPKQHS